MSAFPILLVDDDEQGRESARRTLELEGYAVHACEDGQEALDWVRAQPKEHRYVILSDVRMPRLSGIEFLRALAAQGSDAPVVLMTAFGQIEDAVQAMKLGAVDFLSKPFKRQTLIDSIKSAEKRVRPQVEISAGSSVYDLIGRSPVIEGVRQLIRQVAPTSAAVLITGESGTGKERVARALHEGSTRKNGPFVAWNCAAVPESLVEAELFGFEKGAFTGATSAKAGLFELADGGTLFMDEIGDMPLLTQAKLLRVIQEGEVRRVGATQSRQVDVRIVAATHRDLAARTHEGYFREDLLYRLEVIRIEMPALRDRLEDLPILIESLLRELGKKHGKFVDGVSDEAFRALLSHRWPGNIRELANALERAMVFAEGSVIECAHLPPHLVPATPPPFVAPSEFAGTVSTDLHDRLRQTISIALGTSLKEVEDLMIKRTLEATDGDKLETARLLGINTRTIYRRLSRDSAQRDSAAGTKADELKE